MLATSQPIAPARAAPYPHLPRWMPFPHAREPLKGQVFKLFAVVWTVTRFLHVLNNGLKFLPELLNLILLPLE